MTRFPRHVAPGLGNQYPDRPASGLEGVGAGHPTAHTTGAERPGIPERLNS